MADIERQFEIPGTTGMNPFATASDRLMVFIEGCQPAEAVLDAEQAIGTWPVNRFPDAFDVALGSFGYRFGDEPIPTEALSQLILIGTAKLARKLEIDPSIRKLRLPERFKELDPAVLEPAMDYYVRDN